MKTYRVIASMVLGLFCSQLLAANITQIDRYASVSNQASKAQINPLLTVQQVRFPQSVKTVGDAVNYWVRASGFHIVEQGKQSDEMKTMMKQPLPIADRELGPMAIQEGLEVLAGKSVFHLVQDPLNRALTFKLNRKYRQLAQSMQHKNSRG